MKELSLNILDIVQNSVRANADVIEIDIHESGPLLTLTVKDNGHGMKEEFLKGVLDPFTTTRTTRKVGLGLPLLKMVAEQTGGSLSIRSKHEQDHEDHGTTLCARFYTDNIDCPPLGDIVSTIVLLIQGAPFAPRYIYRHCKDGKESFLDTDDLHEQLGADIPLSEPEVLAFVREYLTDMEGAL